MTKEELKKSIAPKYHKKELAEILFNMPEEILTPLVLSYGQPNHVLAQSDDPFKNVFILLDGQIRLSYELNTEFSYTFAVLDPVNILGETEAFTDYLFYKSTITCVDTCKYIVMPKVAFISWMKKDNNALLILTSFIATKYSSQVRQDRTYLSATGEDRFIYLMVKYYDTSAIDGICTITTPKEYLADEICVSNKTISRSISKLKSDGLLTTQGHNIIITEAQYNMILDNYEELFY